jgi:methyl-accepting chemotaxis protein
MGAGVAGRVGSTHSLPYSYPIIPEGIMTLSIRFKLNAGFGIMALLVVMSAVMLMMQLRTAESSLHAAKGGADGAVALAEAQSDLWELRYATPQFMVAADEAARKKIVDAEPKVRARIEEQLKRYAATELVPEERKQLKAFQEMFAKYMAIRPKWFELYGAGSLDEAKAYRAAFMTPMGAATVKGFSEMIDLQQKVTTKTHASAAGSFEAGRQTTIVFTLLALVIAAAIPLWVIRAITRPLGAAITVAQRVASGDLTSVVEVKRDDEFGALLKALCNMNDNLKKIVTDVRTGTNAISTGSKEIASGNADLSQRTEEQASSLEETASSMEELTSTVKQNAENAKQANQLAAGASDVAIKGGEVVSQVVQTMSAINQSSKKIVDIISVIDGIAFQTNILALNAAVEAARAGEQGRGFAVVATEVRTLAQRSAAAAKEIKELIANSVEKVNDGTRLVDQAGKTMDEIVSSIKRVTIIMADIASASKEQSSGIEQVNQAISQMDHVTQQNAALVEEAAAASESLEQQARSLGKTVAVFNVGQQAENEPAEPAVAERRGPERPANVARLPAKKVERQTVNVESRQKAEPVVHAKTGTDDEWSEF